MYQLLIFEYTETGNHLVFSSEKISADKAKLRDYVLANNVNAIIDNTQVIIESRDKLVKIQEQLKYAICQAYKEEDGTYEDRLFNVSFCKLQDDLDTVTDNKLEAIVGIVIDKATNAFQWALPQISQMKQTLASKSASEQADLFVFFNMGYGVATLFDKSTDDMQSEYTCPSCGIVFKEIPLAVREQIYDSCELEEGETDWECNECHTLSRIHWQASYRYETHLKDE
jgi:hypothetical protein